MRRLVIASSLAACYVPITNFTGTDGSTDARSDTPDNGLLPPSCDSLLPTCGPSGTSSCCESAEIPGGMFYRSYDVGTDNAHSNANYPSTVSSFRLDKYEVTVGRFRRFVMAGMGTQTMPPAAGAGAHAAIPNSGWDPAWNANLADSTSALTVALQCSATFETWTPTASNNENRPINCITWYEAMAFCAWDGGFLPTEAEWNYAAAGGIEQRAYPWSSPPSALTIDDSTYASYWVDMTKQCMGDMVDGCTLTDLVRVGSKPAGDGRWGQSDLAGNIWEWTLDLYAATYPTTTCNDCANLAVGSNRVRRGGSFKSVVGNLRGAYRYDESPSVRDNIIGVRCVRRVQ